MRSDLLEPFTTRVSVTGAGGVDPTVLVADFLQDIAMNCEDAGSSLIGHIKCHVEAGPDRFHCHLTSLRQGARCERASAASVVEPVPLAAPNLRIDLAVLVYGLTRDIIGDIVAGAAGERSRGAMTWSLSP